MLGTHVPMVIDLSAEYVDEVNVECHWTMVRWFAVQMCTTSRCNPCADEPSSEACPVFRGSSLEQCLWRKRGAGKSQRSKRAI